MLHNETQIAAPPRRRFIPCAAMASIALVVGTIAGGVPVAWGVFANGDSPRVSPAVSSVSMSPTSMTVSNATRAPLTTQIALPAYFVGTTSSTGPHRFGLYREFVRTAVPPGATPAQKAKVALAVAMNAQKFAVGEPYLQPWSGVSVRAVTVTPKLVTITLSGPGAKGSLTAEQSRLAVQGLVWTAQAAIGRGPLPVKFAVADGSARLFGAYSTARTYNRPAMALAYRDLAPIWITSPARGHVFAARTPVVAKGESCAFEANTRWQLKKGAAVIRSGFTTASSGCPTRGTWRVKLGVLPAGAYTFRMYELSMEDGQGVVADTSKTFSVK